LVGPAVPGTRRVAWKRNTLQRHIGFSHLMKWRAGGLKHKSTRRDGRVRIYVESQTRLQSAICHLHLAWGGPPRQILARRRLLPVSKDTLLRGSRASEQDQESHVAGITDCRHLMENASDRATVRKSNVVDRSGARFPVKSTRRF
jgi:hypothetical protein